MACVLVALQLIGASAIARTAQARGACAQAHGADPALRTQRKQTARDIAVAFRKTDVMRAIDEHFARCARAHA